MRNLSLAAALVISVVAAPAAAITVFDIGDTRTINYNGVIGNSVQSGLTASMDLTLNSITQSGNRYLASFSYDLSNTSSGAITASRVSIFGFDLASKGFSYQGSFGASNPFGVKGRGNASSFGNADICFKAGASGNNCSGAGGNGLRLGSDALGSFTLAFSQELDSVAFDDFFVRYQSVDGWDKRNKKFKGKSGIGYGTVVPQIVPETPAVPEPATWAMLIAGFGMVGVAMRRRQRVAVAAA